MLRSFFTQGRQYEALARSLGELVQLLARDVTEQLQAEAARRQIEQRFRILVEGVKEYGICLFDSEGRDQLKRRRGANLRLCVRRHPASASVDLSLQRE